MREIYRERESKAEVSAHSYSLCGGGGGGGSGSCQGRVSETRPKAIYVGVACLALFAATGVADGFYAFFVTRSPTPPPLPPLLGPLLLSRRSSGAPVCVLINEYLPTQDSAVHTLSAINYQGNVQNCRANKFANKFQIFPSAFD